MVSRRSGWERRTPALLATVEPFPLFTSSLAGNAEAKTCGDSGFISSVRDHRRSESTKAGLLRASRPYSRPSAAPAAEEALRDTCHVKRELLSSIPIKYRIKPKPLSTASEVAPRAPVLPSSLFCLRLGDQLGPSLPGPRFTIESPTSRESWGQDTAVQWVPCLLSSHRAPDLGHSNLPAFPQMCAAHSHQSRCVGILQVSAQGSAPRRSPFRLACSE